MRGVWRLAVLIAMIVMQASATRAHAAKAEAAPPPLSIAVFTSRNPEQCFDNGYAKAIEHFVTQEVSRLNQEGTLAGRQLRVAFYDDLRDEERAIASLKKVMDDKMTIAMVGLSGTSRASKVFEAVARELDETGIPFMSDISVRSVFERHQNVFTIRNSQEDERLPVIHALLADLKVERLAFIGMKDHLFSSTLGDGLKKEGRTLTADFRVKHNKGDLDEAELNAAIEGVKRANADFLVLGTFSRQSAEVLSKLITAGFAAPVLVTGSLDRIFETTGTIAYPNTLYQLAWDSLPGMFSERMRQRVLRTNPERWIFNGDRNAQAPGWRTGECKPQPKRPRDAPPDIYDATNMRAIERGTQYADMVALVGAALRSGRADADVPTLRRHILNEIKTRYATGTGMFRGQFDNWSFRPNERTASRTPLILRLPAGAREVQLAPRQYVRLRNDKLRPIQTLYLDVDLVRLFRVEDNEKSFYADFYLSMFDDGTASIDQLEFANAYLDPRTNAKMLSIKELHKGGDSDTYPAATKLYRVTGRFMFRPDFTQYPFDTQQFSIDLQPKQGDMPFILQPPKPESRDRAADTDGWIQQDQYVGYDEDFIPMIDARTDQRSVVPFYKGNFSWIMKRETTDYYLRVVIPLVFILIVAYLSIFIPRVHFEAIVTIQVTALLSAVALYLAIPKMDSETATISDKIFLFDYMAVSLMIGISILRVSPLVGNSGTAHWTLALVHIVFVPILVAGMGIYTLGLSLAPEQSASDAIDALMRLFNLRS